jgi:putative ABC transport system ATP-binding protein
VSAAIGQATQPDGCSGTGQALIEMRQVVKLFHTPAGDFKALKGIDVCFYEGEFVAVVGRSGSGKSTLVNMITGIDHPTSGSVVISGTEIHRLSEGKMSVWRGRNLGIVFQFYQLLPMLSLLENVLLPMDFANTIPVYDREERARGLLELVGLLDSADLLPAEISGGQQQSAAIARALANDPPMIIADEPTGNLDSRTAAGVFSIFTQLAEEGKTIIMVTHDPSLARRTHRSIFLSDGSLVATPTEAQR